MLKFRQQLMAKMPVDPSDPAVILAFQKELQLTPEQIQGLQKILTESRSKALELLTADQKTKIPGANAAANAGNAGNAPGDGADPAAGKPSKAAGKRGAARPNKNDPPPDDNF
jgi:hypothetical protein